MTEKPSPLVEAIEKADLESMRESLSRGANTEDVDKNGMTALHLAAYHGNREAVSELVSAGANIRAEDRFGRTPLTHAVFSGHESIVVYLLLNGVALDDGSYDR